MIESGWPKKALVVASSPPLCATGMSDPGQIGNAQATGFSGAVFSGGEPGGGPGGTAVTERRQPSIIDAEQPEIKQKSGRCCRCCCCCGKFWLVLFTVWISTTLVGREFERAVWMNAADTQHLYSTARVCGHAVGGAEQTFANLSVLMAETSTTPVHCGDCGACSNAADVGIMRATQDTLTNTAIRCSLRIYYGGRGAVFGCFRTNPGFSDGCNECWTQNVVNNFQHCKFTCAISLLLREENNDETGELTSCLLCDERMCGPTFLACAGANRRRLGITSDIQRAEAEQCKTE